MGHEIDHVRRLIAHVCILRDALDGLPAVRII